jgi:hypothetical protein
MVLAMVTALPIQILIKILREKRQLIKKSHRRISYYYSISSAKNSLERISRALTPTISG